MRMAANQETQNEWVELAWVQQHGKRKDPSLNSELRLIQGLWRCLKNQLLTKKQSRYHKRIKPSHLCISKRHKSQLYISKNYRFVNIVVLRPKSVTSTKRRTRTPTKPLTVRSLSSFHSYSTRNLLSPNISGSDSDFYEEEFVSDDTDINWNFNVCDCNFGKLAPCSACFKKLKMEMKGCGIDSALSPPSLRPTSHSLVSLADQVKDQERRNDGQDLLEDSPLTKALNKAVWRRSPGKGDEFWESLQSHYNYLMDGGLIESCKEANGELFWNDENNSQTHSWTFAEYVEQYKDLIEWLEGIQQEVSEAEENGRMDKSVRKSHLEEMTKKTIRRKQFNEQSQCLSKRYPNLKDEIGCQVENLNCLWDKLEQTITPKQPKKDSEGLLNDINQGIRCLRKWLHEMEGKLRPLIIHPGWALEDLEEKYKSHQVLQKDIETRGKNVTSVLKLCDRLQSSEREAPSDTDHVQKVALNLERRWHAVWLRSLEWQCLLEELINKYKAGLLPGDNPDSSFGDEPLKKYPRLSGGWTGKSIFSNSPEPEIGQNENLPSDCLALSEHNWNENDVDIMEIDPMPTTPHDHSDIDLENEMHTRDIGTNYEVDVPSTNDKGVMVGTTGIAELKAECCSDGSYGRFEIIQDVGYSSESSAHLSNDERGEFIQVYSYSPGVSPQPIITDNKEEKLIQGDDIIKSQSNTAIEKPNEKESSQNSEIESNLPRNNSDSPVNRSEPNCATFYFRHIDTDSEYKTDDQMSEAGENANNLNQSNPIRKIILGQRSRDNPILDQNLLNYRRWTESSDSDTPKVYTTLTHLDFSESDCDPTLISDHMVDWSMSEQDDILNSNMLTDTEKLVKLGLDSSVEWEGEGESDAANKQNCQSKMNPQGKPPSNRDTIHELVEQAERLVREERGLENSVCRAQLEPLKFGESCSKSNTVKEWLQTHHLVAANPVLPPASVVDSSCDASGEYTSNDSDDDHSISSEEQNNSVILCRRGAGSIEGIANPETPVAENPPPVQTGSTEAATPPIRAVLRNKKRASGDRPWSVTEMYQLTNCLDLSPFSISESALNKLPQSAGLVAKGIHVRSRSIGIQKDLASPSSDNVSSGMVRKAKSQKSRRRISRRAGDSSSDGLSHSGGSFAHSGSDGGIQRSPSHRRQSASRSKSQSQSSGSESCRLAGKQQSQSGSGSGGAKNAGLSSGTECCFSEVGTEPVVVAANTSDSESEVIEEKTVVTPRSHNEELSSVSEQAWDDYQDAPYLSEAYSEKAIDDEQIKKLMEFGDDYSMFIESHSDSASLQSYRGFHRSPSKSKLHPSRLLPPVDVAGQDSDSDLEDLHHIIEESSHQLQFAENMLHKSYGKENLDGFQFIDYAELLATCQTNIKCLRVIEGHLKTNSVWTSVAEADIKQVTSVVHRWEMLQNQAQEQQQVTQKIREMQQEIAGLRDNMSDINRKVCDCGKNIDNRDILARMIQDVQTYLNMLQDKKTAMLTVNLQVHSFLTETGQNVGRLKEEVTALYQQWNDVFEKSSSQLTALQNLNSMWQHYETEYEELMTSLEKDQKSLKVIEPPEIHSATTVHSPNLEAVNGSAAPTDPRLLERQSQLSTVQALARELEAMLTDSTAWSSITHNLNSAAAELRQLQETCRKILVARAVSTPPPSGDRKRVRFSKDVDEIERARLSASPILARMKEEENKRRPLLWRVVRAALPIQFAIVVLFCIACLLEPHCCDSLNNFSLSFSPQLRYVRGPPPV